MFRLRSAFRWSFLWRSTPGLVPSASWNLPWLRAIRYARAKFLTRIAPLLRLDCGAELHRLGRWPMHSASYRYSSTLSRGSRWRRAIALFLAVLVHPLLILMYLRQSPPPPPLLDPPPRSSPYPPVGK